MERGESLIGLWYGEEEEEHREARPHNEDVVYIRRGGGLKADVDSREMESENELTLDAEG